MGEPVLVAELAKTLVRLSGKSDPEFEFIGLRPGEKLFEELFYPDERVWTSACEKITCTESGRMAWPALKRALDALYASLSLGSRASILARLKDIVPQFTYENSEPKAYMEKISAEKMLFCPLPGSALHPVSPLGDMSGTTYRAWVNPVGPATSGNGD
jgi:hypothetical protein